MIANSAQRWLRVAAALLLATTSVAAQSTSSAPFVPEIAKTQLADGVFLLAGGPDGYVDGTNTVVVVNDNGVLVFDTSTRPSTARAILAEIRKITDKPVRYVVNSHWHPDHWSGNEVFADAFPNVEFIATEQAKTYMLNMGNFFAPRFKQRLPKTEAMYASEIATGKDADGSTLSPKELADETTFMTRYRTFVAETQTVRRTYPTLTYVDELVLADVQKDVNMDDFRVRFTKDDPTLNKQFAGFASGVVRLAYLESRDNQESRP